VSATAWANRVTGIGLNGSASVSANATLKVASKVDTIEVVAVGRDH